MKHWAEHGRNFEYLVDTGLHDTPMGPARRKLHYEPQGVVGAITPWNVPFYLNVAETVPALMAGNTVVLKPAQLTPWSGTELGRIVAEETDIPAGVFNVVVGNSNDVGAALSADPRVDMITFTGSTATGRAILAAGAPTVKKTLLELGGNNAVIVHKDADLDLATRSILFGAVGTAGQRQQVQVGTTLVDDALAVGDWVLSAVDTDGGVPGHAHQTRRVCFAFGSRRPSPAQALSDVEGPRPTRASACSPSGTAPTHACRC